MNEPTTAVIEHNALPQAITPMQMLSAAVAKGVDTEQLTKLMDLQERWEKNEARKSFVAALTAFKTNAPKIVKTKEVSFGAGKTAYKHALAGVASEVIGEALAAHGLSHRWDVEQPEGGKIRVTCVLTHAMGHMERVTLEATPDTSGSKNSIQAIGSTVSYLQRYSLFAATGLVPKDADDDGKGGAEHHMAEGQIVDFKSAIEALPQGPTPEWDALWESILAASTTSGDVGTHEILRGLMAAKRKVKK